MNNQNSPLQEQQVSQHMLNCKENQEIISNQQPIKYLHNGCQQSLQMVTLKYCKQCKKQIKQGEMFNGVCVQCVRDKFEKQKNNNNNQFQNEKQNILVFLKKFCANCQKPIVLNKATIEQIDGVKQDSLDNNLCQSCSINNKKVSVNLHQTQKQSTQNDSTNNTKQKDNNVHSVDLITPKIPQQISNIVHKQCPTCKKEINQQMINLDGLTLCHDCFINSNQMQQKISAQKKEKNKNIHQNKSNQKNKKQEVQKIPTAISLYQQQKEKVPRKKNVQVLAKTKICVNVQNDDQMVECMNCGYVMEFSTQVWNQQINAAICQFCYTDFFQQGRQGSKNLMKQRLKPRSLALQAINQIYAKSMAPSNEKLKRIKTQIKQILPLHQQKDTHSRQAQKPTFMRFFPDFLAACLSTTK